MALMGAGSLSASAAAQPELAAATTTVSARWSPASREALVEALRTAVAHGLDASALARQASDADDAALNRIALSYAAALTNGVVDPKTLHETFSLQTNRRDLSGELDRALRDGDVRAWFASLAPSDETYRALQLAYAEARSQARQSPDDAAPRERARVLAVNMERLRWLARQPPATRIDVNIAAAKLWFFKDGSLLDSRRVVAGRPGGHETPLLQASFRRIVVNPPWIVPQGIAKKEILLKGSAYMERHNMRLVNGRVIQDPGPDSSLGQVKFDLDDDQDIYLHDTPQQSAFQRADRHLSHGCIRVEDAVGFARLVADQFGAAEKLDDQLATGETGSVLLSAQVPVRLLYLTAYLEDGQVRFVRDRYGWDARLAEAAGLDDAHLSIAVKA